MYAEKLMLETDAQGLLKSMPALPPNCQVDAIFIVLNESISPSVKRHPSPVIAGQGKTLGDLIAPIVPEDDWECLQ